MRAAFLLIGILLFSQNVFALGGARYIETNSSPGSFPLFNGAAIPIIVASNDWSGVVRAARDLSKDIEKVTGALPDIGQQLPIASNTTNAVIIGTIGYSHVIDQLVATKKIDVSRIAGNWESYFIQTVSQPFPGLESALVICGSDKRGTIFGIYDLSEQIGVSPWYWWADVPPKHHSKLFVAAGKYQQGPPSVKYRGIFLNDEAPALSGWVTSQYGNVNGLRGVANYGRGFYTNVFELLLRMRANYLWPAMWGNAFNEDDPENPRLADEYGIVMGTSHQEPMLRAQQEWDRGYGRKSGAWNYNNTNQRPVLVQFWREGIRRNKDFESIITMGLRAENDSGAPVGKVLTEEIVNVQRKILAEEANPDPSKIPQLWCLYKEVMAYYADGLRVPDDITLLWADDNWGNVRRLPTAEERTRSGGAGIYYHFDYHGGPRSYQWINTSPIAKIWDQMSLAKQYGADRIWIVNVGHFNKSGEFPLEFFMQLAWDTGRWNSESLDEYTLLWAEREFGPQQKEEIAKLITTYTRFNGRRKPELLEANTYNLHNYHEFETVAAEYNSLAAQAQAVYDKLPQEYRNAFFGMVQYPIKAAADLNTMYLAAAKNMLYARQERASANDFAAQARSLFRDQTNLANYFNHEFANGRWNHFMDQTYIGYRSWDPPRANNLSAVRLTEISVPEPARLGVAAEGYASTDGGILHFDKFGQADRYVDVFNQGQTPFPFTAKANVPWIKLSQTNGTIAKDVRIRTTIDWSQVPSGTSKAEIAIAGAATNFIVAVSAFNPAETSPTTLQGFVEADGYVSMEAEHYTRKADSGQNRWKRIQNYGHTLSGMRAEGPTETETTPGINSPCLEYKTYIFNPGTAKVEIFVGPTLNFLPNRSLRYAVSFDDEKPQTVTVVPMDFDAHNGNRNWEESVKNNYRRLTSTHSLNSPGYHTLKLWMIDPGLVVQKIVVNTGEPKASYLGAPESLFRQIEPQER